MARSGQGHAAVTAALARMAIFRQADVGDVTLDLFSAELAEKGLDPAVVVEACNRLAERPRGEGETAFPELGRILAVCHEVEADLRLEKMRADAARAPQLPEYTGPSMTREEAKAFVADLKRRVAERIAEGKGHAA